MTEDELLARLTELLELMGYDYDSEILGVENEI